jgi:hypothetical protein
LSSLVKTTPYYCCYRDRGCCYCCFRHCHHLRRRCWACSCWPSTARTIGTRMELHPNSCQITKINRLMLTNVINTKRFYSVALQRQRQVDQWQQISWVWSFPASPLLRSIKYRRDHQYIHKYSQEEEEEEEEEK